MEKRDRTGLLKGKEQICGFLHLDWRTVEEMIIEGMPVKQSKNRYYAHVENLETWLKVWANGNQDAQKKNKF